jgi:hypothetical protein
MATTLTGTGVTFSSGNEQTEAVQTSLGGIGAYTVALPDYTSDGQFNRIQVGTTVAGSTLRLVTTTTINNGNLGFKASGTTATTLTTAYASILLGTDTKGTKNLTGTWRLMSGAWGTDGIGNSEMVRGSYSGLWVRIS